MSEQSEGGIDRSDATIITTRHNGHAARTIFEPRDDGRYDAIEETLTEGGEWRTVGYEIVDVVEIETPD
jgi:hypothetical protein